MRQVNVAKDRGIPDDTFVLFPPFAGLSAQLARRMISIIRFKWKVYAIGKEGTPRPYLRQPTLDARERESQPAATGLDRWLAVASPGKCVGSEEGWARSGREQGAVTQCDKAIHTLGPSITIMIADDVSDSYQNRTQSPITRFIYEILLSATTLKCSTFN